MSVALICASTELSTNSTIEWMMLCGCTTTSTRAISTSKSHRASIISRPLLKSVAESIVIFDPMRRFAAGEMAEIAGPVLLKNDREQRILGLRAAARKAVQNLPPRDRAFFEAYARGVNAFIESHRGRLPIEFRLMRM